MRLIRIVYVQVFRLSARNQRFKVAETMICWINPVTEQDKELALLIIGTISSEVREQAQSIQLLGITTGCQ